VPKVKMGGYFSAHFVLPKSFFVTLISASLKIAFGSAAVYSRSIKPAEALLPLPESF
jgi:hypothetical protein